jgi:(1->4)-alpha-D-glucan 1-alpha-D-glucosylmutase
VVAYYDKTFPTSLASYLIVLERALDSSRAHAGNAHRLELESIIGALRHLPSSNTTDALAKASRARETNVIRRRLARLCSESEEMRLAIDDAVAAVSQNPDTLSAFLGAQNFRLSYWKVATEEINYRRFFDVNELAAVRMEEPRVFAAAHSLLLDLVRDGRVTGVRLDHTDGLYDPEGYLRSLQASVREALREGHRPADAPIYVVAEKILQPGEELPRSWSLSGTTGYDYLAVANGLWVDPSAEPALTRLYVSFTGDAQEYAGIVHQAKRDVMDDTFSSEIHVLAQRLKRIAEASRDAMDFTLPGLTRAIKETVAALSVYRTYLRPGLNAPPEDERHIADAVEIAKEQNPRVEPSLFDFLRDVLMLRVGGAEGMRFTMKFQQITSPVMAKGVEDTAQYRFSRLVCLNDVGCDPARFGAEIREFHQFNSSLLGRWPLSMTTTSTHDTKRTEDVRTRLAVLSEIPDIWGDFVQRVDERRRVAKSGAGVRARDAYLFYQTVVGAWPFTGLDIDATPAFVERIVSYMQKAAREAKLDTSWKSPNVAFEETLERFVRDSFSSEAFGDIVGRFVDTIVSYGASNSLAQLALRLAGPGVPDVYQGCERWDLSLVDPDNRRRVDYGASRQMLAALRSGGQDPLLRAKDLVRTFTDGRIKMFVTTTGLTLRRSETPLFLEGSYEPLESSDHVVAFERRLGDRRLVCVAPRLARTLTGGQHRWAMGSVWGETMLKVSRAGSFEDAFTGRRFDGQELRLSEVLSDFPVAWLLAGR